MRTVRLALGLIFAIAAYWLLAPAITGRPKPMPAFLLSPLGRWAGGILAACLVLALYTGWIVHETKIRTAAKVETRIVTRLVKETGKETERRVEVLKTVQVRSQKDVQELARLATKLAVLQQEVTHASTANDDIACLSRDSVLRLAAVR